MAHIGVIRVLEENNIPIDYISGTSIGAIVGGLYAAGYSPDEMEELFRSDDFYFWSTGRIQEEYRYYFNQPEATPSWLELRVEKKEDKLKVLLVDWKPRWETRFAANILQRLNYVELNRIIIVAQENARLKRGVEQGTWPESPSALGMYDLVVLGDLPQDILRPDEWEALGDFVTETGRTLCLLGADGSAPVALPGEFSDELLPAAEQSVAAPDELSDLDITGPGRLHPMTSRLGDALNLRDTSPDSLREGSYALLTGPPAGAPLVSCRFAGRGRVAQISTDGLWKTLNPTHLGAHTQLFVRLLNWSVNAPGPKDIEPAGGPELSVDSRFFNVPGGLQIWGRNAEMPGRVLARDETGVVAEATLSTAGVGLGLARATFEELPAGRYEFSLAGEPGVSTSPVFGLAREREFHYLAQDRRFLDQIAGATGGESRPFVNLEELVSAITPRQRTETHERRWRLWDMSIVLILAGALLTIEWVWRKMAGLV